MSLLLPPKAGLLRQIFDRFILNRDGGVHGLPHWERVYYWGLCLGRENGADLKVVQLFAYLHDSCRENDLLDTEHGRRAAHWMKTLPADLLELSDKQMAILESAIAKHADGDVSDDVTIQTCWDADRLDLWRVGIEPNPFYLSDEAATLIEKARKFHVPTN